MKFLTVAENKMLVWLVRLSHTLIPLTPPYWVEVSTSKVKEPKNGN